MTKKAVKELAKHDAHRNKKDTYLSSEGDDRTKCISVADQENKLRCAMAGENHYIDIKRAPTPNHLYYVFLLFYPLFVLKP